MPSGSGGSPRSALCTTVPANGTSDASPSDIRTSTAPCSGNPSSVLAITGTATAVPTTTAVTTPGTAQRAAGLRNKAVAIARSLLDVDATPSRRSQSPVTDANSARVVL